MDLLNWKKIIRDKDGKIIEIHGFKSFGTDGRNINGITFEEGKIYHCDGEIVYGPLGNGYHMALNLEDTLRFSYNCDGLVLDPIIALVIARGNIAENKLLDDDYAGYYDLFACSDLEIVKYLSRKEIIEYGRNLTSFSRERFLTHYKLLPEELEFFWDKKGFNNIVIITQQLGYDYEEARKMNNSPHVLSYKRK